MSYDKGKINKLIARLTRGEFKEICEVYFLSVFNDFDERESFNYKQKKLLEHVFKHPDKIPTFLNAAEEKNAEAYNELAPYKESLTSIVNSNTKDLTTLQKELEASKYRLDNTKNEIEFYEKLGLPVKDYLYTTLDKECSEVERLEQQITLLTQKHPTAPPPPLRNHYDKVISALTNGELVFFLGSDFNRFGRSQSSSSVKYPLTTKELVECLIKKCSAPQHCHEIECPLRGLSPQCPLRDGNLSPKGQSLTQDGNTLIHEDTTLVCPVSEAKAYIGKISLNHISQFARLDSPGDFLIAVQEILKQEYSPTNLHTFLATLPAKLREKKYPYPYQLIVTSNYDDVLEKAFRDRKPPEEFDLIFYDKRCTQFSYKPWEGEESPIDDLDDSKFSLTKRTVILKINGDFSSLENKPEMSNCLFNFLMTENDYMSYLTEENLFKKLPLRLRNKLCSNYKNISKENISRILFLGYLLRDWNERIFLNLFWKLKESEKSDSIKKKDDKRDIKFPSWVIHHDPDNTKTIELKLWESYEGICVINKEVSDISEEEYIEGLDRRISELPSYGG